MEIASQDAGLLPEHWEFGNYLDALKAAPFATYARNSFIIAFSHTLINVVVASMAGYALARIRFRGSEVIFYLFIAALMIPTYTKVLPEFLIVRFMPLAGGNDLFGQGGSGWLDSWWALIVPGAVTPSRSSSSGSSIWTFRWSWRRRPGSTGWASSGSTPGS